MNATSGVRRNFDHRGRTKKRQLLTDSRHDIISIFGCDQIPLIQKHHRRASCCRDSLRKALVLVRCPDRGVDHQKSNIGSVEGIERTNDGVLFSPSLGTSSPAHPRRVDKPNWPLFRLDDCVDSVASRSWHVMNDRAILTNHLVEQC